MLKNYLKIALRNLRRHKTYSFINVVGLAVGLACCLLISLYVKDELSYDRYHAKADRIFKIVTDSRWPEKESKFALTPAPLAEALVRDFPEVETATRLFTFFGEGLVAYGEKRFTEPRIYFGDSTFFEVFSIPLLAGDARTALARGNAVVLTQNVARKYFGEEDPLGKTLSINHGFDVQITGVMAEVPANTHFHCDFVLSMTAMRFSRSPSFITNNNFHTYAVLRPNASPQALEAKFPEAIKKYAAAQVAERFGQTFEAYTAAGNETKWTLVPVTDIHLRSNREYEIEPNGSLTTVYLFASIAAIVLLIACINFMNLATARSAGRAKEIGVRKVIGSNRLQLLGQFLTESLLLSFFALLIALVLVELFLPTFNQLAGKQIEISFFANAVSIAILLGVTLLVGLLAGSYPAFVLSAMRPALVLKSGSPTNLGGAWIRRGLVVFQFAISVALIAGTFIVHKQLGFVLNRSLGFDKEQVLVIKRASALGQQREAFKQKLLQNSNVINAAASTTLPGKLYGRSTYRALGAPAENSHAMHEMDVDENFLPTLGLTLNSGRNFSREFATDTSAVILNEAAAKLFGWNEPLGQFLTQPGDSLWRANVIGVVKDFHFESLHKQIQPLVILYQPNFQYWSIRVRPENLAATVQAVETLWREFAPQQPFEFSFLDQDFDAQYRAEERTGKIFGIFSALAIFIACLGQFGLASFTIQKRTKEIGVRKVLGASAVSIVSLLSKEFVKLVLLATLIASPLAYYIMHRWLQAFAYRIDIGVMTFILSGSVALVIALLTVSLQSLKAALANPVEALRYE
jgi:putative ABC transport system permease protein